MMTTEQLQAFFDQGWNRHDVDALMTFMADDCVFESASGAQSCGARHAGPAQVRAAFARVFAAFPDVQFADLRHLVSGERGLSEWVFVGTAAADGRKVEVEGCDLFTFRGDKIAIKRSYMKMRAS